ncbi:MAG: MBOAT family O-acyltransferase [Planctomycetota bacterium]
MIFTEPRFFLLFALCFAVYWSLRANGQRKVWLVLCSAVFYGAWDVRFLALMYVSVTLDYTFGRMLDRPTRRRRAWLIGSIAVNLGILGTFKYLGWFVESAVAFGNWLGFEMHAPTLKLVLPIGISFYTFQSMSYTIDVYRRQLVAAKSYLDFAAFVTFFPQLVAGPIVRAVDFLPQLHTQRAWLASEARGFVTLFCIGYFKKVCIADNVSQTVDAVFSAPVEWTALSNWIAAVLYAIQIYCDFSGYSDMAIALAGLLGYRLTTNFEFPYLAANITEFWRRWHVSLSTWFRDYLYIPLGGNRRGAGRTYWNLVVVFFLCGLWHGASWNFVVWGLLHGAFLVVHRSVSARSGGARWPLPLGVAATWIAVVTAWVFFRGEGWAATRAMLAIQYGVAPGGSGALSAWWLVFAAACLAVHVAARRRVLGAAHARMNGWMYAVALGTALALLAPWIADGYQPFIYFQF